MVCDPALGWGKLYCLLSVCIDLWLSHTITVVNSRVVMCYVAVSKQYSTFMIAHIAFLLQYCNVRVYLP